MLFDIDLTKPHNVLVSNIVNPLDIFIQLASNVEMLNTLMDDLERSYEGIGASHYNMPKEYIKSGKLCAAKFKTDNNWHRCKIIDVIEERKLVRVLFIEYVVK
jgi:hypothetical protein